MSIIKKIVHCDDGAVTVDWVVLTAAVVVLAGAIAAVLGAGEGGVIDTLKTNITNAISPPQ